MGACFSCCGGEKDKGQYAAFGGGSSAPDTVQDQEARARAAEAAANRQNKFETSAVGKAAYKSVNAVKEERKAGGGGNTGQPTASDWQN